MVSKRKDNRDKDVAYGVMLQPRMSQLRNMYAIKYSRILRWFKDIFPGYLLEDLGIHHLHERSCCLYSQPSLPATLVASCPAATGSIEFS